MTTTNAPSRSQVPVGARRFGYLVAVGINALVLWIANRLLEWGWPGFLTDDFERVLPVVTASLLVGMVVNAVFVVRDRGRVRALGDLVNAVFGVVVSVRLLTVFPFDFSGYGTDWSWVIRTALILGIVVMSIAVVVNLVKLVTGRAGPRTT